MRSFIYYRIRAENIQIATELIEFYSNVIQRKNNCHVTGHTILNIFQYRDCGDPEFYYFDNYLKDQQLKWIHEVNTEHKYIEFIKQLRLRLIISQFNRILDIKHKLILDQLNQTYTNVNDRESESEFLRSAETILMPITLDKWKNDKNNTQTSEEYWRDCTLNWRSLKRHTSLFSFPFIRPGMDIYRSFAYDIGKENDPIWYSNVYYLY